MDQWDASVTIADSDSVGAATPVTADVSEFWDPVVFVALEDLEGNADDTVTIRAVGQAGTYRVDQRTLSAVDGSDDYTVDIPQVESVEFESSNGVTYSAEVRANP